jgi:hypothetical protein
MKLLTKAIENALAKDGLTHETAQVPICKFFNPCGAGTWLIFAREKDEPDILWGLADLGMDYVEYGTISLSELQSVKLPFGLTIERDLHFTPKKHDNGELWKLSDYLDLSTLAGI